MKKYTLDDYALLLENNRILKEYYAPAHQEFIVDYLTFDSKKVKENTVFVCKGVAFKAEYLDEAIRKGAIAYVSEKKFDTEKDVPYFLVEDIRKAMSVLAEFYNNKPWKELNIIGIGGTKGKSTSTYYMKAVVDDYMEAIHGKESGLLSTIEVYDGVKREDAQMTTPESIELQEHLRNAADSGISFLEMEVSSQAYKCGRVDNMKMDVGVFLNISEDHISPIEHPDFEDYFSSKLRMFQQVKCAVVNLDTDFVERILEEAKQCETILTFSTKDPTADVYGYAVEKDGQETVFRVRTAKFDEVFRLSMSGLFNVENALAVIATAMYFDIPTEYMKSGLYRARSKGRMELFSTNDGKMIAIVDFAHNKLSFEKLFSSTRQEYPDYRLTTVFGCPGGKAVNRRRDMGTVAGQYADKVYVTGDDPAQENVSDICAQIAKYVEAQNCPYEIIEDRDEAILKAFADVEEKTVILVVGKGNEEWYKLGKEKIPRKPDTEFVKEWFEKKNQLS